MCAAVNTAFLLVTVGQSMVEPLYRIHIIALGLTRKYLLITSFPSRSKFPIFEVSGPKSHTLGMACGTRVLNYWVLGPSGFELTKVLTS